MLNEVGKEVLNKLKNDQQSEVEILANLKKEYERYQYQIKQRAELIAMLDTTY
jgi:hypothetical protein